MSSYLGDLVKLENFNGEGKVEFEMTIWELSGFSLAFTYMLGISALLPYVLPVICGATEAKDTSMQYYSFLW